MQQLTVWGLKMADDADNAVDHVLSMPEEGIQGIRGELSGEGAAHCNDCGVALSVARRRAAPWAVHCVPCLEVAEIRKGQRGGY